MLLSERFFIHGRSARVRKLAQQPANDQSRRQSVLRLVLCAVVLVISLVASLALGAKSIEWPVVVNSLLGNLHDADSIIVLQSRLPRTLLGLLVGIALGISGLLIQSISGNPLAEPGILGVNAGASFAVVLGISLFSVHSPLLYWFCAFSGAMLTSLAVYAIGRFGVQQMDPVRFILVGVAVGAVLTGFSSGLTLLNPAAFDQFRFWSAGSLDIRDLDRALLALPGVLSGTLLALYLSRSLNALSMGEELAATLGSRPLLTQSLALLAIALLCGTATAAAGPITFVGLMIPHLARRIVGNDHLLLVPCVLLTAPILLLWSDIVGRVIIAGELRVSIVTAFIGAPVLIWLARRQTSPGRQ